MMQAPSPTSAGEAELLNLLAVLASTPLPLSVLHEHRTSLPKALSDVMANESAAAALIDEMVTQGVLVREQDGFTLAPAVHTGGQTDFDPQQRKQWASVAVDLLWEAFPDDPEDAKSWRMCEQLIEHVLSAVNTLEAHETASTLAARLMHRAGTYLLYAGQLVESRDCLERTLRLLSTCAPSADPLVGTVSRTLSEALCDLGEHPAALRLAESALEIHLASAQADDRETALDHMALATVHSSLENLDAAGVQIDQAISLLGDNESTRLDWAMALELRGWVLLRSGEPEQARVETERALHTFIEMPGAGDRNAASARSALGVVLLELKHLSAARAELERALLDTESLLGPDHPEVAVRLSNLSNACLQQGELDAARQLLERSLVLADATLPRDHPTRRSRLGKLVEVLERSGDFENARRRQEELLTISKRCYGPDDPRVAEDLEVLGEQLVRLGDLPGAQRAYRGATYILETTLGPDDTKLDVSRHALAQIGDIQGEAEATLESYQQLVQAHQRRDADPRYLLADRLGISRLIAELGDDLARAYELAGLDQVARSTRKQQAAAIAQILDAVIQVDEPQLLQYAYAVCLQSGRLDLARTALEHLAAHAYRRESAAEEVSRLHRLLWAAWHRLGRAFLQERRYADALAIYERGLELLRSLPQTEPGFEGVLLHGAADVRREQGDLREAITLYREAVKRKESTAEPFDQGATLSALARTLELEGSTEEALTIYEHRLAALQLPENRNRIAEIFALHDIARLCRSPDREVELSRRALTLGREAEDPIAISTSLLTLGRAFERRGDLPEALDAYRERLSILTELPERDHQAEGVTLHDIADVRRDQGEIEEAIALYERAIRHKHLASRSLDLARTQLALGRALEAHGDLKRAAHAYEERLSVLRALIPRATHDENTTLRDLARVMLAQGELERATTYSQLAIDSLRQADEQPHLIETLMLSASVLLARGQHLAAARHIDEALMLLRDSPRTDSLTLATALILQARCAEQEPERAFECLSSAMSHLVTEMTEHPVEASALACLASDISNALGNNEAAQITRTQVRAGLDSAGSSLESARDEDSDRLLRLASAFLGAGQPRRAESALEQAGHLEGASRVGLAAGWHQLGRAFVRIGIYADAARAYDVGVSIIRSSEGYGHHILGVLLHDIADLHRTKGQLQDAIEFYRQAAVEKRAGHNDRDLASTFLSLGRALKAADDSVEAIAAFDERLAILQSLPERDRQREGITFHAIADVLRSNGHPEEALELYRKALTLKQDADATNSGDQTATLLAIAQLARRLHPRSARRWARQIDALLHQREISLERRCWSKVAQLPRAYPGPLPGGRSGRTAAKYLQELSAYAIMRIVRLHRTEAHQGASPHDPPDDWPTQNRDASQELLAAGLTQRPDDGLERLTPLGRKTALSVHASVTPVPTEGTAVQAAEAFRIAVDSACASAYGALISDYTAPSDLPDAPELATAPSDDDAIKLTLVEALVSLHHRLSAKTTRHGDQRDEKTAPLVSGYLQRTTDPELLHILALAALSYGDRCTAQQALERMDEQQLESAASRLAPSAIETAVFWHILGTDHEAASDFDAAWGAYSRSALLFSPISVELHAAVMHDAADMFHGASDSMSAKAAVQSIQFRPVSPGLRTLLGSALLRFSRVERLLAGEGAGIPVAMRAIQQLRFAVAAMDGQGSQDVTTQRETDPLPTAIMLDRLTPAAIALLDVLAEDAAESGIRGIVPGLFIPGDEPWRILLPASELEAAGLATVSRPATAIAPTARGLMAASMLVTSAPV
jgi:tetratricopeptide (TPR) repeat protein